MFYRVLNTFLISKAHILLLLLFYQAAKAVFSMFSPAEEIIELLSPSQNNPHSFKITWYNFRNLEISGKL